MYDDLQWTSQLYKSPKITFSTIYCLLVDRKVSLKKISHLEEIVERSQDGTCEEELSCDQEVPIEYTRTLGKAFVFLKIAMYRTSSITHFHKSLAMCVLDQMFCHLWRKTTVIILNESTAHVASAHCACPAGLSSCCDNVMATLYCLEEYIYLGLYDDEIKYCTDRLQKWNQPRKQHIKP